jgi:two-component system, cell cycle response regulator
LSRTDALTGLANRRELNKFATSEFQRSKRFDSAAAVLMIDIDHFKKINDTYGHDTGDEALVALAALLKKMARSTDLPARFGGEEFAFLLAGTDALGSMEMAERIRMAVAQIVVNSPHGDFGYTVSIGCAPFLTGDKSWNDAMTRADIAMYQAKVAGRDRVILSNFPEA